ncbi:YihY/virulence factor BrkB family protein [Acaryochloris marina NIES-2412]|uniref:YihY/virulence factor BrkB family protein n=1 Tax=Acaryochloris marina TaxID=155978 RepID=UPI004059A8F0
MSVDSIFWLLKMTGLEWQRDKASRLAAALAYYTAFSLAPVLVIVIAIASLAFGQRMVQGEVMEQFNDWLGPDGAAVIRVMIRGTQMQGSGIRATLSSLALLFVGSTGLFTNLKDALNTIWRIQPKPDRGWQGFIRDRILAFVMVLGVGLILILTLGISTGLTAVGNSASTYISHWIYIGRALDAVFSFSIITLIVALIYKILPDVNIQWSDVWIGASLTSLLFALGKFLISLYLSKNSLSSTYGAAGSLAVTLLWVNYSAQIFFFGAELTQVYTNRFGSQIRPARYATALQAPTDWVESSRSQAKRQKSQSPSKHGPIRNLSLWGKTFFKKLFNRKTHR